MMNSILYIFLPFAILAIIQPTIKVLYPEKVDGWNNSLGPDEKSIYLNNIKNYQFLVNRVVS